MTTTFRNKSRPWVRGLFGFATTLIIAGLASMQAARADARALPQHRVLVVVDQPGDPFMERVVAELSSIKGLDLVAQPPTTSLDTHARGEHAEIAIRKLASGKGVEVWMADTTSGRSLVRQIVVDENPDGPDQSLIALQTGELLRTALSESHDLPTPPDPGSPRATCAPMTAAPPPSREDAVQAGLAFLSSGSDVSPALQAWISYHHAWSHHWGLAVDLSAPLTKGTTRNVQGSADVSAYVAGAGLLAQVSGDDGKMQLGATVGGAFASVHMSGRPLANYVGESLAVHTGLIYVRLHGGWRPLRWLGFGASALFGATTARVRIQFANQDVAKWGLPVAAAGIYGEIRWN